MQYYIINNDSALIMHYRALLQMPDYIIATTYAYVSVWTYSNLLIFKPSYPSILIVIVIVGMVYSRTVTPNAAFSGLNL